MDSNWVSPNLLLNLYGGGFYRVLPSFTEFLPGFFLLFT